MREAGLTDIRTSILNPKQQHLLYHRLEKGPQDPWCCALPSQDPLQSPPALPRLCQIPRYRRPVVIPRRHHPPQVCETGDRLNLLTVDLEGHLRALPYLHLRQPPTFPFHSALAHHCALVAAIKGPPRHKHVTVFTSRMGEKKFMFQGTYQKHWFFCVFFYKGGGGTG